MLDRGGSDVELCASAEALPDGRIIAVGYASAGGDRLTGLVVRLNADAGLDTPVPRQAGARTEQGKEKHNATCSMPDRPAR